MNKGLEDKRIVCFGDSNTWGFTPITGERYPKGVRWTSLLGEYTGAEIIEEGLNGRTSAFDDPAFPHTNGLKYIEACVDSHRPFDLLIVMLGTNDMRKHICNCTEASARSVAYLCQKAQQVAPEIKILMVAPIVIGKWRPQLDTPMLMINQESIDNSYQFGERFEENAKAFGFEFLDAAKYAEPSQADAIHMTPENHQKLARAMADKVFEIFSK